MPQEGDTLDRIFARTRGRCHICHSVLARSNYGQPGRRGAWEVDHSRPKARGGSDHLNNYFPACISCNRAKGAGSSWAARRAHGRRRAPMSETEFQTARERAAISWAAGALVVGRLLGATPGGLLLMTVCAGLLAYNQDPEED